MVMMIATYLNVELKLCDAELKFFSALQPLLELLSLGRKRLDDGSMLTSCSFDCLLELS